MITAVILINAVKLGLEISPAPVAEHGTVLHAVDWVAVFVVERALRFAAYGGEFFRDRWNWLDTVAVGTTLLLATDTRCERCGCCACCSWRGPVIQREVS